MTQTCPRCRTSGRGCGTQDRPAGHFCVQWGFTPDTSSYLVPSPDPVRVAAEGDPQVIAAMLVEREKQAAYDDADAQWSDAVGQLSGAQIRVRSDEGEFSASRGWRPSRKAEQAARALPEMAERVRELARLRERASDDLTRARVAYQQAVDNAYRERGLGVISANHTHGSSTSVAY